MNASQLLGYAITNETIDCLFTFQLHTCVTLQAFNPFFNGENIIQSYSKSLVSNQDSKTW